MEKTTGFRWGAYVAWTVGTVLPVLEVGHLVAHLVGAHGHHDFQWLIGLWQVLGLMTLFFLVGLFLRYGDPHSRAGRAVDAIIDMLPSWGRRE